MTPTAADMEKARKALSWINERGETVCAVSDAVLSMVAAYGADERAAEREACARRDEMLSFRLSVLAQRIGMRVSAIEERDGSIEAAIALALGACWFDCALAEQRWRR